MQRIRIIDSHTGGEPTRLVIGGFPDLGQGDMAERRRLLGERHDAWRAACILLMITDDGKGMDAEVTE
ncbi:proline racemase family protein, partial [Pseudomonas aeruginosa]|nr:proline racemase family protein [Pseudomonas aeruginosa]